MATSGLGELCVVTIEQTLYECLLNRHLPCLAVTVSLAGHVHGEEL